jgi:hypothetical protein
MFPSPTADPAAAMIKPIRLNCATFIDLPLWVVDIFNKIAEK